MCICAKNTVNLSMICEIVFNMGVDQYGLHGGMSHSYRLIAKNIIITRGILKSNGKEACIPLLLGILTLGDLSYWIVRNMITALGT